MVLSRKICVAATRKSSSIVGVVFLSLISCTVIYGKTSSATRHENFEKLASYPSPMRNLTNHLDTTSSDIFIRDLVPSNAAGNLKTMARRQAEERTDLDANGPCRSFIMDVAVKNEYEFYSPGHAPNQPYPRLMDCVKTITAPPGHLLRLDFRNEFHLEQSEDCRFDYLEIRDGAHGYSNLIGSYCGNKHPPPVTSSDRYLWLRFASDENIQYSGFHAVYWFVPRPTNSDQHPELDMCRIEVSGNEGFANRSDIDEDRVRFSTTYGLPLDCMWIISVEQGWKIMLQFLKFRLEKPNDCESNFVDVFSDRTDLPSRLKNFCGSIADSVISKSNILHLRFFAESRSINSTFEALFTAFRDKPRDEACDEDEYDCEDATCISVDLRCNGRINCRFRWDEDECQPKLGAFAVILESEHIIIILIVFCLILSGMCFAFLFNCTKKLIRDHRIIQEHLRQSKENVKERSSIADSAALKITTISNHARSRSNSSSDASLRRPTPQASPQKERSLGSDCYVPAGDVIPIFGGKKTKELLVGENLELSVLPEMRDSECQTRESLFSTQLIDLTSSDQSYVLPADSTKGGNYVPPFSTFGYTGGERKRLGHPRNCGNGRELAEGRKDEKRYRAEAVIEMDTGGKEDPGDVRPFSIDSTKSAPDVIVTH